LSSLLGLGIAIVLVLEYGLYGALLNCIVSQSIIILVSLFLLYKEPWFTSLFAKFPTDWQLIKQLGGFTLMSLTSAIVVPFSQLSVRSTISSILSLHDAGIWEGMNRLSAMYLTLITSSIGIYYLPRLAELTKRNEIRTEIYKTFALVMPVLCLASLSIFLLRDFIVRTVYTSEFDSMRELFGWQMLGDIFKIGSWLIAYLFWAKGLVKLFLITEVAFSLMYIVLTKAAVTYFGLQGSVIAYAVNYIIYFIVMIILFKSILVNQDETGIIAG
jgi:PST family polysaccharide transporter